MFKLVVENKIVIKNNFDNTAEKKYIVDGTNFKNMMIPLHETFAEILNDFELGQGKWEVGVGKNFPLGEFYTIAKIVDNKLIIAHYSKVKDKRPTDFENSI